MQLVSNDSCAEDSSETEPILCQSNIEQRSEESSSLFEIRTVEGDCLITGAELQSLDVEESCSLVNADQPQCRICLEIEGIHYLLSSISISFLSFWDSWGDASYLFDKKRCEHVVNVVCDKGILLLQYCNIEAPYC